MIVLLTIIMIIARAGLNYPYNNKDIGGIKIVGPVPAGFPPPSLPRFYPDGFILPNTTFNSTTNSTISYTSHMSIISRKFELQIVNNL